MKLTPAIVSEYAQQVESEDPIDWGMLAMDENAAYNMVATSIVEHYESLEPVDRDLMLLASITKLVVENMALSMKLQHK